MSPSSGGPPRVVAGSAAALVRRGHQVTIVALVEEDCSVGAILESFPELASDSIIVRLFPVGFPLFLGNSPAMKAFFIQQIDSFDVVHVHGVWEGCFAQLHRIAQMANLPFLISAHGMLDHWSVNQSRWKKSIAMRLFRTGAMLKGANAIIYGTMEELVEGRDFINTRGEVVPNGIHTANFARDRLPDDRFLLTAFPQIREWKRTVLFFSRVHPKKGLDLLVDAFIANAANHPSTGLLIAGIAQDGRYEATIRKRIASSSFSNRIVFTTELVGPSALAVFRQANIFVLPSRQEGFSIALLEAMALQIPVLLTDRCHLPEVERSWQVGCVVPSTGAGVAHGLDRMLKLSEESLRDMGERARCKVVEDFDWAAIAVRLEALYCGAADGLGASA
jgi:glycosyltransferase involved in cell wall biosynthesis